MREGKPAHRFRREAGFTLIEVLAALMIFSVAIIGLAQAGTESARAGRALETKMIAGIVADNVLTEARRQTPFRTGRQDGHEEQMGADYNWDLEIAETEMKDFYRLTVRVYTPSSEQVSVMRQAFRAVEK